MKLTYLLYGGGRDYELEAKFSILSAIANSQGTPPNVVLLTDVPNRFDGWPVTIRNLPLSKLAEWLGPHGYIHRRKTCAIREALIDDPRSIFIDTDTFFLQDPQQLAELLKKNAWLVDHIEARWGDWNDQPTYHALARVLAEEMAITDDMPLINSGVLAFRDNPSQMLDQVIELTDRFYPLSPVHIMEQFCMGVIGSTTVGNPAEASEIVHHYFKEKRFWRAMIRTFFERHGETFSPALIEAFGEMPSRKPKPAPSARALFKLRSVFLSGREKRLARFAFFAVSLPDCPYANPCRIEYLRSLADNSPSLFGEIRRGTLPASWHSVFSKRSSARLFELAQQLQNPSGL